MKFINKKIKVYLEFFNRRREKTAFSILKLLNAYVHPDVVLLK